MRHFDLSPTLASAYLPAGTLARQVNLQAGPLPVGKNMQAVWNQGGSVSVAVLAANNLNGPL